MTYNITIYSKDNCPFCDKIHRFFHMMNLRNNDNIVYPNDETLLLSSNPQYNVTTLKLGEDFTQEQFIAEFGDNATFPRVILDGELIGGCREAISHFMQLNRPIQSEP